MYACLHAFCSNVPKVEKPKLRGIIPIACYLNYITSLMVVGRTTFENHHLAIFHSILTPLKSYNVFDLWQR